MSDSSTTINEAMDEVSAAAAVDDVFETDAVDRLAVEHFPGKIVRKDLTALMKRGANVPTFVLEYLLGMYCSTDDPVAVEGGLERIRGILLNNYVRPDESEVIKSKIRELGSYTVIDKIIVALKMNTLLNDTVKGTILIVAIIVQTMAPVIREHIQARRRRRLS